MRRDGLFQGVDLVDLNIELAGLDEVEDAVGVELELLARDNVLHQGGAHDGDVLGRQARDVEGWDGPGCCDILSGSGSGGRSVEEKWGNGGNGGNNHTGTVVDDFTLPLGDFETALPGVLADTVVGDVDALAVGELHDLLDPARPRGGFIIDDMGRAVLLGQLGLLGSAGRADDGGAQVAQELAEE